VRGSAIIVQQERAEGYGMANVGPVGVGIIGAGMISEFYLDRESARSLVDLARQRGLLLGIAPDTLLGRGWQTGYAQSVRALSERRKPR
jgi:hypothetical protein